MAERSLLSRCPSYFEDFAVLNAGIYMGRMTPTEVADGTNSCLFHRAQLLTSNLSLFSNITRERVTTAISFQDAMKV